MPAPRLLAAALALLSLLGCSRRTEQVLPENTAPGAMRRPEPPREVPPVASAIPDDEPRQQSYELKSPDGLLQITVEHSSGTGTMHFADRVRIAQGGQVIERSSHVTEQESKMAPLIDRIVPLSDGRYLLLGWASQGAGKQQDHALLIGTSGKLTLLDELINETHRARAALFVRTGSDPAVGVPADSSDLGESDRWSLTTMHNELDAFQFLSIKRQFTSRREANVQRYAPPFHQSNDEERQVVWFSIDEYRIHLPEVLIDAGKHLEKTMDGESFSIPKMDQWADVDGDGHLDALRCIGDGCLASPCVSYHVYLFRPGGSLFAGDIGGNLGGGRVRLLPMYGGLHKLETSEGTRRVRFEQGRYRTFEGRECDRESKKCSPWEPVTD